MKSLHTLFVTLMLLCFIKAQPQSINCAYAELIMGKIKGLHVQPRSVDENFREDLIITFLHKLDPYALHFTASDLKALKIHDMSKASCPFLLQVSQLYQQRLRESIQLIQEAFKKPINWNENYCLTSSHLDEYKLATDDRERTQGWNRIIRLRILMKLSHKLPSAGTGELIDTQASIVAREIKRINHLLNTNIDQHVSLQFFKAIAELFDPHTQFLSKEEMLQFQNLLSTREESFGLEIMENELGEAEIVQVLPGGSAWNTNEIHAGDKVLQIRGPQDMQWTNLDELEDLDQVLPLWPHKLIKLVIKKADGRNVEISLEKTLVDIQENRIDAFILKGTDKDGSVGYINLPSFYTQWNQDNELGCANDIAKELIKLKQEGISGLILDLRFNGGGSIKEAADLIGIFIDVGPVALMKAGDQKITVVKDVNRGIIFDGPMVVMINGMSASASELVAATLQDYNRALIVGERTFGKASGQLIFPVSDAPAGGDFLKITTHKIYRINGTSYQQKGVIPDIRLPDLSETISHEEEMSNSLPADSIQKKVVYTQLALSKEKVIKQSENRIEKSDWFRRIKTFSQLMNQPITLNPIGFNQYTIQQQQLNEFLTKSQSEPVYRAQSLKYNNPLLQINQHQLQETERLKKEIENSAYIREAKQILNDLWLLKF